LSAPIKLLLWELISVFVADCKSDVIVSFGGADSSPEKKLVEVSGSRVVQELLDCKFKLEPK